MSNYVEAEGKTVNQAIEKALIELGIEESEADIEIINEGTRKFLGMISSEPAVVRVREKFNIEGITEEFFAPIFNYMSLDLNYELEEEEGKVSISIFGNDVGILIGHRGETLNSLQYLLSLVVNKKSDKYIRINLDIENYKQKREDTLIQLANRLATKVSKYKKSVTLEPMTPYERRIIHSTLQPHKSVQTFSIGEEPNRKVVIKLK